MKGKPRITIIGAGSFLFTLQVLNSLIDHPKMKNADVCLYDIDAAKLDVIYRYIVRLIAWRNGSISVRCIPDRDAALKDADYVLVTVAIGGLKMRKHDVEVSRKYGIVHVKGDTTGPAGIFRALRSIPFIIHLARDMEKLCPHAVMINLSNPMSTITRAVAKESSIKVIGICTTIDSMSEEFAKKLNVQSDRIWLQSIGVNHFTWLADLLLDGKSRMDLLESTIIDHFKELPVTYDLYRAYGAFPIPGYKYASEFFPYYLSSSTNYGEDIGFQMFNEQAAQEAADKLHAKTKNEADGLEEPSIVHGNLDSDIIVKVIESSWFHTPGVYNLNLENRGRVANAPDRAIVEGPVYVCGDSMTPLCIPKLPDRVSRLLERVLYEHERIVRAAVEGDKDLVLEAFLLDPLVNSTENARKIIDELMILEKEHLPSFIKAERRAT